MNYIVINRDAPESPAAVFPINAGSPEDAAAEWMNQAYMGCPPSVPVEVRLCIIPEEHIYHASYTIRPASGPQFEVEAH